MPANPGGQNVGQGKPCLSRSPASDLLSSWDRSAEVDLVSPSAEAIEVFIEIHECVANALLVEEIVDLLKQHIF